MGKNTALCVKFCCVQFAMLYLQNHSFMLTIICGIKKIICGIGRLTFCPLVIIAIELFWDVTLAWDPTFIKYPMN